MPFRNTKYILNEAGEPVVEPNLIKWAEWVEKADRIVDRTAFPGGFVSTAFGFGIDHNWMPDGPPILWETMVFGGPLDQETNRCAGAREQAMAMHQDMVDRVNAILAIELPSGPDQFSQQP